jgi:hypothetical protein
MAIAKLFVVVSSRFNGTEGIYGCCEKRQDSRFSRTTRFGGSHRFWWRAVTIILSKLEYHSPQTLRSLIPHSSSILNEFLNVLCQYGQESHVNLDTSSNLSSGSLL